MAPTLHSLTLESLLDSFRQVASALPDARRGSNCRYSMADAACSALSPFFMQDPSFLAFQRRMQDAEARSNCQFLFGIERIPSDNCIRSLLDGCPTDAFDALFPACLETLADNGALAPFLRLDNRLLIALDGIEFSKSYKIHCKHCSTRHVGKAKTPQYFHSMVCPRRRRRRPRSRHPPHARFHPASARPRRPQHRADRPAPETGLRAQRRQALDPQAPQGLSPPTGRSCSATTSTTATPSASSSSTHGGDFLFVCKPDSHKCLYDFLHPALYHSTGWLRVRNARQHIEFHRYRWQTGVPVRDGADAVTGTWIEFTIRRKTSGGKGLKQTYYNTFFTSLEVTDDNVAAIARAGRSRWKIENENFNCLSRHGYNLKHNFGHGSDGLANLLAVINLLAFAFHSVLDCLQGLWRQLRELLVTRRDFFENLRVAARLFVFPHWTALLETLLKQRPPPALARGPTRA